MVFRVVVIQWSAITYCVYIYQRSGYGAPEEFRFFLLYTSYHLKPCIWGYWKNCTYAICHLMHSKGHSPSVGARLLHSTVDQRANRNEWCQFSHLTSKSNIHIPIMEIKQSWNQSFGWGGSGSCSLVHVASLASQGQDDTKKMTSLSPS